MALNQTIEERGRDAKRWRTIERAETLAPKSSRTKSTSKNRTVDQRRKENYPQDKNLKVDGSGTPEPPKRYSSIRRLHPSNGTSEQFRPTTKDSVS